MPRNARSPSLRCGHSPPKGSRPRVPEVTDAARVQVVRRQDGPRVRAGRDGGGRARTVRASRTSSTRWRGCSAPRARARCAAARWTTSSSPARPTGPRSGGPRCRSRSTTPPALLPIEFTEVTITRTLFRAGDSEYQINGAPCRLLDIQELLSDTGIGRQQHVIVGQGQLDAVLNSRPEDRRGDHRGSRRDPEVPQAPRAGRAPAREPPRATCCASTTCSARCGASSRRCSVRPTPPAATAGWSRSCARSASTSPVTRSPACRRGSSACATQRRRAHAARGERAGPPPRPRRRGARRRARAHRCWATTRSPTRSCGSSRLRERARGLAALLAEKRRGVERELAAAADEGVVETLVADAGVLRAELAELDRRDRRGPAAGCRADVAGAESHVARGRRSGGARPRRTRRAGAPAPTRSTTALDAARAAAGSEQLAGVDGVVGPLVDHLEIEPGAEAAVAAALGDAMPRRRREGRRRPPRTRSSASHAGDAERSAARRRRARAARATAARAARRAARWSTASARACPACSTRSGACSRGWCWSSRLAHRARPRARPARPGACSPAAATASVATGRGASADDAATGHAGRVRRSRRAGRRRRGRAVRRRDARSNAARAALDGARGARHRACSRSSTGARCSASGWRWSTRGSPRRDRDEQAQAERQRASLVARGTAYEELGAAARRVLERARGSSCTSGSASSGGASRKPRARRPSSSTPCAPSAASSSASSPRCASARQRAEIDDAETRLRLETAVERLRTEYDVEPRVGARRAGAAGPRRHHARRPRPRPRPRAAAHGPDQPARARGARRAAGAPPLPPGAARRREGQPARAHARDPRRRPGDRLRLRTARSPT